MNSILKNLAFSCLILFSIDAFSQSPASVTSSGQIILSASNPEIQNEYIANISHLGFNSEAAANSYFDKYIRNTSSRGITYSFDSNLKSMYIHVTPQNQLLLAPRHQKITVTDYNYILKEIFLGNLTY